MEWTDNIPSIVVVKEPSGKRYSYLVAKPDTNTGHNFVDRFPYLIKSCQSFQLGWKRLMSVLDIMDSSSKIESSILKHANMDAEEANRIIDSIAISPKKEPKNIFSGISGRSYELMLRIFPVWNDHILTLGMEKVVLFYDGIRHPNFTIEMALEDMYVTSEDQLNLARCLDYFIWKCIQDIDFVGILDFSKELKIIKDRPPLEVVLDRELYKKVGSTL